MKSSRRDDADTISNLPCNVLEGILGCLPLKDAVKTSILSKDWRYKWVTRREIVFDYSFFESRANGRDAYTIIYQVLLLHKGPIAKFTLRGRDLRGPDVDHWILYLSKKNVEEFTLQISGNNYRLPFRLFTFKQLRHLKVYGCSLDPPPGFNAFGKLTKLDLSYVTLVPTIFRILTTGCPLLEQLRLSWCTDFDDIEIDAPNLKRFEYKGKRSKSICFKNAPMLGEVSVYLLSQVPADPSLVCPNLSKFFHYMPSLLELELGGHILEYLTMGGILENPPSALNNIKTLSFVRMYFRNVEEVSGAVYLIRSCPKLQELTVYCHGGDDAVGPIVQFLRAQSSSSYGVAKLLRMVHVEWLDDLDVEMEFMKFILAAAPVLKEVSIWNPGLLSDQGTQMIDKMKEFGRASRSVEFTLEVCEEDFMQIEDERLLEVP